MGYVYYDPWEAQSLAIFSDTACCGQDYCTGVALIQSEPEPTQCIQHKHKLYVFQFESFCTVISGPEATMTLLNGALALTGCCCSTLCDTKQGQIHSGSTGRQ